MECKQCGRQLPDGALFCKYCGARTQIETAGEERREYRPRETGGRKKKKSGIAVAIAAACIVAVGAVAGVLIWRSNSGDAGNPNEPPADAQVQLTASVLPENPEAEAGEEIQLSAAIDQDLGERTIESVVWSSDRTEVATVEDGIVTTVGEGTALITATYTLSDNTVVAASTVVTVTAPAVTYAVALGPDRKTLAAGETVDLAIYLHPQLTGDTTQTDVQWKSSDEKVATVDDGKVTAVAEGNAVITVTVTLSDGQTPSGTAQIAVTKASEDKEDDKKDNSSSSGDKKDDAGSSSDKKDNGSSSGNKKDNSSSSSDKKDNGSSSSNKKDNNSSGSSGNKDNGSSGGNGSSGSSGSDNSGSSGGTTTKPTQNSYVLPQSNSEVISYETLRAMSDRDLWLARNELYARHGRKFKDAALQDYFNSQAWYHGTVEPADFSDSVFSEVEHTNVDRIVEVEAERKG